VIAKIYVTVFFFLASLLFVVIVGENAFADEAIPFTERDGLKYVTVQINGVPVELVFDTGANSIVLNNDALQSLGISEFDTSRKLVSHTAGGVVEGYVLTLNSVMVGSIQRHDYDVAYVPSSTKNLLGSSLFSTYNYYVDEDYKVIRLIPKGSFVFDSPWQPQSSSEDQRTGSGHIEVEMDGKKYIYGHGWQGSEVQDK